ncbi:MAG: hypothetical protein DRQ48_01620 [Gammaproteobacteria bacterium]|nr:MAG: hypothetical protein DRQ58_00920 [Gammaproteobacteria bacterium]RKZ72031.1 MAG: hypothetical protein DRQ48_01620 [Gammaproteobacteria bacterium]
MIWTISSISSLSSTYSTFFILPSSRCNHVAYILENLYSIGNFSLHCTFYYFEENSSDCGVCDSCQFRKEGFENARITDPTHYKQWL